MAPHPDDDIIGVGGTACLHVEQGDPVHIVILGNGQAGDAEARYEPEEFTAIRRREAIAAGAHLSLTDYEFWDYPEGFHPSADVMVYGAHKIAQLIRDREIDIVYAPWVGEYHLDHHTVGRAVRMALALGDFQGEAWGYEVWTPLVATMIVDISAQYDRKVLALKEHQSQIEYVDIIHKALAVTAQRSIYLPGDAKHGEAFAPLGKPSPEDLALLQTAP